MSDRSRIERAAQIIQHGTFIGAEQSAVIAEMLADAGMLATREEWTVVGVDRFSEWQAEKTWSNRYSAQSCLDTKTWMQKSGGRIARRHVTEWNEVDQ